MIVLDTSVIPEMMCPRPAPVVVRWLERQLATELFTTAITVAEVYRGIELLIAGGRRQALSDAAERIFVEDLAGRTLAFDADAARIFARTAATRQQAGRAISQSDAQIASIVQLHGATLATRNLTDFEFCGIRLIDPWQA